MTAWKDRESGYRRIPKKGNRDAIDKGRGGGAAGGGNYESMFKCHGDK